MKGTLKKVNDQWLIYYQESQWSNVCLGDNLNRIDSQKNLDHLCENAVWTSPESGQHVRTCLPDFLIWTAMYLDLDPI